jgi:plasmid stabilization system protein ParE
MIFTVLWTPTAEQELASIWLDAEDRNAVTSAAHTIDALLRADPHTRGESRHDAVRVLFVPPLGVDFDVVEADRIVYVLTVWSFGKRETRS